MDGPADPRAAPSARGSADSATAKAGGGGVINSIDVQRQLQQGDRRGQLPLPANPYANTRKRPRAEVQQQQQQQPPSAQPQHQSHGQQSQPQANRGAVAGAVVVGQPSTLHVGVNGISNATGDRNAGATLRQLQSRQSIPITQQRRHLHHHLRRPVGWVG